MEESLAGILRYLRKRTKRVILPVVCGYVFPETPVYLSPKEKYGPYETDKVMSISNLLKLLGLSDPQVEDYVCLYEEFRPEAGQKLADLLGKKIEVRRSHPAIIGICDTKSYEPHQTGCCPR